MTITPPFHPALPNALRYLGRFLATCVVALSFPALAAETEKAKDIVKWQDGPGVANLKNTAEVKFPEGFRFANGDDTRRLLRAAGEPTSGQELGMLQSKEREWSVFFDFSDDGYVKDDDKDKLDPDKILKSIKKGNDYGNEERKRQGVPPLNITGWKKEPFYDEATHNLEWAIGAESEGRPIVNYNVRLLGRRGVMEVILVCDPEKLPETLPAFKELLAGYSYKSGETYAEYKQGDKLAKYGLTALVAGGAVAVAAKTGLLAAIILFLKKGWKLVVLGVVAIGAFIKRLIFGRNQQQIE